MFGETPLPEESDARFDERGAKSASCRTRAEFRVRAVEARDRLVLSHDVAALRITRVNAAVTRKCAAREHAHREFLEERLLSGVEPRCHWG